MMQTEPIPISMEHDEKSIRRLNWLDAYPLSKDEQKYKPILDYLHKQITNHAETRDIVRAINKLAFSDQTAINDRSFLLRLKDWIARGTNIFGLHYAFNPTNTDQYAEKFKVKARESKQFDNYTGTQRGIYTTRNLRTDRDESGLNHCDKERYEIPGNFEHFLKNRIRELLDSKEGQPVIMVDFGGVQSITTLRMARIFKNEIDAGKLVLVVSNLSAEKENVWQFIERDRTRYGVEEMKWIEESFAKVFYVQADATELLDMKIQTSHGVVDLRGNVDIMHEASAISSHGVRNELDFALLADCLSGNGLLLINRYPANLAPPIDSIIETAELGADTQSEMIAKGYEGIHGDEQEQFASFSKFDQWQLKAKLAVQNLKQKGLLLFDSVKTGERETPMAYAFFVKDTAIPVKVYDQFNKCFVLGQD